MNITIIGTGYVGLITGLCFSAIGNNVICLDIDHKIVNQLNKGISTFYEEGLDNLLKEQLRKKSFIASVDFYKSIIDADIVFIAVGTPSTEQGEIDLSFIEKVGIDIGKVIKNSNKFLSIVIKSTVLPTTTDTFLRKIIEKYSQKKLGEFGLGMNPEFLREGSAIKDFMNPDRIVLGYEDEKTKKILIEIYKFWDCEKILVNTRTAELIKYTNNSFLALLISATNEIANLSSSIGNIDFREVMKGVKLDKRWNPNIEKIRSNPGILEYMNPGYGFGGSCFPKDVKALVKMGSYKGKKMKIMNSVLEVNDSQTEQIINDLENYINVNNKKILLLGLAFKPGTDDIRESSALNLVNILLKKNAFIYAHDPVAIKNFSKEIGYKERLTYIDNWDERSTGVDIIILLTGWQEYFKIYSLDLSHQIILDSRGILDKKNLKCKNYISFGKQK